MLVDFCLNVKFSNLFCESGFLFFVSYLSFSEREIQPTDHLNKANLPL